jgi:hypothetical protein
MTSITAVVNESFAPPRVELTLTVPAGTTMSQVSVWRDDFTGRNLLRSQPLTGFDTRLVFDFEAPFGVPVVYGWTVTYVGASSATVTEFTPPVTVNPEDGWLIAPQSPGLSFPLARVDPSRAGLSGQSSSSFGTNTTVHRILGASVPVTTTSGPRQAEVTGLQVRTVTDQESRDLLALLATDFPILLNTPPSWNANLPYGFFQVGNVDVSRVSTVGTLPDRVWDLPVTRVRSPIADVENVGWDYAELATAFASYAAVQGRFTSYANLAANVRS